MQLKSFLLILLVYLTGMDATAQSHVRLGARASVGSIIAHSSDLQAISQSKPYGISGSMQWMKTSRKNWEACNCFHYLGLEAYYYNFNYPSVLGAASGIAGTFEPLIWKSESWVVSLRTGIGFSYLGKVHDPVNNPSNIFFSSPLSFLLFVAPAVEYQFSDDWSGSFSLNYNHISNGGQKQPNKGMNFPMLELGIFRYLSRDELPRYEKIPVDSAWKFLTEAAFTTKNDGGMGRKPVLMLATEVYRSLGAINALGAGVDWTKDFSLHPSRSFRSAMTLAPFLSHHFTLGRIDFSQWMAYYLYKPKGQVDHTFYQRYILRYRLWDQFAAGIGLKAHGHVAENIDFRLAWYW